MLCVLAVFVPSFFMVGVPAPSLYRCRWRWDSRWLPRKPIVQLAGSRSLDVDSPPARSRRRKRRTLTPCQVARKPRKDSGEVDAKPPDRVALYVATALLVIVLVGPFLGREIFSASLLRPTFVALSGPIGSRVEATERLSLDVLRSIEKSRWAGECDDHAGLRRRTAAELPHQYDLSMTSGQHEAVLRVALNRPRTSVWTNSRINCEKRFRHNFQAASFLSKRRTS